MVCNMFRHMAVEKLTAYYTYQLDQQCWYYKQQQTVCHWACSQRLIQHVCLFWRLSSAEEKHSSFNKLSSPVKQKQPQGIFTVLKKTIDAWLPVLHPKYSINYQNRVAHSIYHLPVINWKGNRKGLACVTYIYCMLQENVHFGNEYVPPTSLRHCAFF